MEDQQSRLLEELHKARLEEIQRLSGLSQDDWMREYPLAAEAIAAYFRNQYGDIFEFLAAIKSGDSQLLDGLRVPQHQASQAMERYRRLRDNVLPRMEPRSSSRRPSSNRSLSLRTQDSFVRRTPTPDSRASIQSNDGDSQTIESVPQQPRWEGRVISQSTTGPSIRPLITLARTTTAPASLGGEFNRPIQSNSPVMTQSYSHRSTQRRRATSLHNRNRQNQNAIKIQRIFSGRQARQKAKRLAAAKNIPGINRKITLAGAFANWKRNSTRRSVSSMNPRSDLDHSSPETNDYHQQRLARKVLEKFRQSAMRKRDLRLRGSELAARHRLRTLSHTFCNWRRFNDSRGGSLEGPLPNLPGNSRDGTAWSPPIQEWPGLVIPAKFPEFATNYRRIPSRPELDPGSEGSIYTPPPPTYEGPPKKRKALKPAAAPVAAPVKEEPKTPDAVKKPAEQGWLMIAGGGTLCLVIAAAVAGILKWNGVF